MESAPVIECCFNRPHRLKETQSTPPSSTPTSSTPSVLEKPLINNKTFYDTLYKSFPKAAIFTVVPGYLVPSLTKSTPIPEPELPPLLTSLYSQKYLSCTTPQVLRLAQCKLATITCTQEQVDFLEMSTRGQSSSVLWFNNRVGRINASVMGLVLKCRETAFPYSLVNSIMQYSKPSSNIPALKWGRLNEDKAREQYYSLLSTQHTNFHVRLSGLHIDTQHPYLGASPDGIVSCDCCGTGLLEIKCPFKYKNSVLSDIDDRLFCLEKNSARELQLKKSHDYYTQIQAQLSICNKQYSDFVCWTTNSIHVERIHVDLQFMESIHLKLTRFFTRYLLPELLTNKLKLTGSPYDPHSQDAEDSDGDDGVFCVCQETVYGDMVACDGPDCPYEWFHFECVGLSEEPLGEWYCSECRDAD